MWDRRFLFSEKRIQDLVEKNFVAFAGNTHELQNGKSPAQDWFMSVARKLKPDVDKNITAQGFYVVGADGTPYGFNNNRSVERVEQFLNKSLDAFRKNPAKSVDFPISEHTVRWYRQPPDNTYIARVFARIKPVPEVCDDTNRNLARDHFWFLADEARRILETGAAPDSLAMRIARFHLVDNVRGEPDHWRASEVKTANMTFKEVHESRLMKTYDVTGDFVMQTADGKRGLEAKLEGRLTIKRTLYKVSSFEAFAKGTAWGRGTYTPNAPEGRFPMVFAFVPAGDAISQFVSPQAAFFGDEYLRGR